MALCFGEFEADEEAFELRRGGEPIPVQRRVLETIFFLARNGGRLVSRQDLIEGPWSGATVSDGALTQTIMLARRVLASAGRRSAIVTVRGRGYRFIPAVALRR